MSTNMATGERGIVCRMENEPDSQGHLRKISMEKAESIKEALEPLLEEPPKPEFVLSWNEERRLWQSRFAK